MTAIKSTEEKAKAYNGNYKAYTELINRLEDVKEAIKKQNYGIAMDVLCKPYPDFQVTTHSELKGSEDERIKEAILCCISTVEDDLGYKVIEGFTVTELKSWLEKQGKNNMGISEATKQKLENNLNKALEKETPESWNKFLDEQGEQNPVEEYNITDIGSKHAEGKLGEMIKNLKPLNEVFEQKPAFEIKTPEESLGIDSDTYNKIVDECIYGEQKFWSEEDEKILNLIIARLHSHPNVEVEEYGKDYHWFNSLKERYTWKPSDEQMKALNAINVTGGVSYAGQAQELISLYNDLKNLSEW